MYQLIDRLLKLRNRHFFLFDLILLSFVPFLALMLRLESVSSWAAYSAALTVYVPVALAIRLAVFFACGLYTRYWLYASVDELIQIGYASLLSTGLITAVYFVANITLAADQFLLPRSLPLIDGLLAVVLIGVSRFSLRLVARWERRVRPGKSSKRVLIVGAGAGGSMIVREMFSNPNLRMRAIGFIDDDETKLGMRIHGVPVLGNRHNLLSLAREYHIKQVVIAMPTVSGKIIRDIVAACEQASVDTKIIPGMYELLDGTVSVNQIRDVEIEDLLRRESVKADSDAVHQLLSKRRVLVTGGGGSIGSELCRQILRCEPSELILIGHGENSVFSIQNELNALVRKQGLGTEIKAVIADVRFGQRIKDIFLASKPEIVFHAAAHKHVPLMELNPSEAVTNNVEGTRNVLEAAKAANVAHFVMISTDKAVNPTSIMGASKRTAELLVHQAAQSTGRPYVAVRFGNVLGSRGSVVLTFKQQIALGGPVTVTDPEMTRFFMTIPEAVQLVLQAGVLGTGGEVFVLDMGDPVKIVDLARDLIELSGLTLGEDIDIVYTGLRPGEKLYEELFVTGERYMRTKHDKIFVAENASGLVPADLNKSISVLSAAAERNDGLAIKRAFQLLIPEYVPNKPSLARVVKAQKAAKPLTIQSGAIGSQHAAAD